MTEKQQEILKVIRDLLLACEDAAVKESLGKTAKGTRKTAKSKLRRFLKLIDIKATEEEIHFIISEDV